MTAYQNVSSALEISGEKKENKRAFITESLKSVGITEDLQHKKVGQLSGGQQQRVAIGRALINAPAIILADEPTGNLDVDTAAGIVKIFKELAHEDKKCVIAVTHSEAFAAEADVVVRLEKKKLQD